MTAIDLSAARSKLDRAREHLDAAFRELDQARAAEPFALKVSAPDSDGWCSVTLSTLGSEVSRIAMIVGDSIQNARSALDYIVSAATTAAGVELTARHQFPIYTDATRFAGEVAKNGQPKQNGNLHGLGSAFVSAVESVQPFNSQGATTALETLNILSNTDKHRRLATELALPAGTANISAEVDGAALLDLIVTNTQLAVPAVDVEIAQLRVSVPTPQRIAVVLETPGEIAVAGAPFARRSGVILPLSEAPRLLSDVEQIINSCQV